MGLKVEAIKGSCMLGGFSDATVRMIVEDFVASKLDLMSSVK